ncbi:MAG: ATP-dependent DNA helicase RecG [Blautia sp.]|nr:ATP-dependent DNA helicase RecG [Blautia sp.]
MSLSLKELKGVGDKTEKLLNKVGIYNTEGLLHYYPRNYESYEEPVLISEIAENTTAAVKAAVVTSVAVNQVRNLQLITIGVSDGTGKISLVWYNAPYLRSTLKKGVLFVFRGKVVRKKGRLQLEHPEVFTTDAYEQILHSMQPVYALTTGLSNKTITKLVHQVLDHRPLTVDYLPEEIRSRYMLADMNFALSAIHFPLNQQELLAARTRLVFDEFFFFILSVQKLKEHSETEPNEFRMKPDWITEEIIEKLPYKLTKAQINVWHEVEQDLTGQTLMSRLIQGDVGSGKTILAFLAMILTVQNGYQAALMVPTEVLARQHYEAFTKLLKQNEVMNYEAALLTGSMTAKEKKTLYGRIASGEVRVIIGTHALIQESVIYDNLGLVITDEQHRFGVKQREALTTRGKTPHVLVMSATPIPRTLAIILYGDLDISVIDELPSNRIPIKNCVVSTSYRPKAYSFIEKQVRLGRQVYIICPMVEESEGADAENVLDYTKRLQEIFPNDIRIGYLHGKMKPREKNMVMESFSSGEIQILVSTTVVEVGVNVPNATVMMVENAERFGLAQLHQLRGRVGRGANQSFCIFIQGNDEPDTAKRLEILNRSNDGFFIAGEDLKLRGPGDLFGIRQSGNLEFRIGDIYNDAQILKAASEATGELLALDPDLRLPQNRPVADKLSAYMRNDLQSLSI